jgi:signal transduction histidine kinase
VRPKVRYYLSMAVLLAVYFAAGKLSLRLAFLNPNASPVWPPAGIALAALLLLGFEVWPALLLGAFLVNVTTSGSIITSVAIAVGNTLEALAGAFLLKRYVPGSPRPTFDRAPDVFRFLIFAAMGSTLIAAIVGVTALTLSGFVTWDAIGPVWLTWWLGDMGGILIVAPLLLLWDRTEGASDWRSWLELIGLFLSLMVVGFTVFGGAVPGGVAGLPVDFLCLPVLIWAAYRFGQREAALAVLLLSGIAIAGTLRGQGPFARFDPNDSLLLLQAFLGASAAMTLLLAALIAERRESQRTLEARVVERTRDLQAAVTRLQEAQEVLVRKERLATLGELAGGVGHDLRNPLGVMTNATYYLGEVLKDAPPDVLRHLDILREQVHVSERIVGNLLDFARGKEPQRGVVPLEQIINKQMLEVVTLSGIEVRIEIPPGLPPVRADAGQVGQILRNLVTNAAQAMEERGGRLTIRANAGDGGVIVEVADTGPGIPSQLLHKVFEPLFTTKARGIGLGLAVSRSLARANDGDLTVMSTQGAGATFILVLPAGTP